MAPSPIRAHVLSLTAVTALATALAPGSGPDRHSFRVLMVVGSGSCSMPEMAMAAELVPGSREGARDRQRHGWGVLGRGGPLIGQLKPLALLGRMRPSQATAR